MAQKAPALEIVDLKKNYGTMECLKGVSLTAHPGDVVTIIGASGSGKSTMLRCINFLEAPTAGRIKVHGEEITTRMGRDGNLQPTNRKQLERIRSRLAMVFQDFNLWSHKTVLANVMEAPTQVLGVPKEQARTKALELLDRVGLKDRGHEYPARLSGGQKQRVAIARALAVDPEVMLFDEPTSALDPELVGEVLEVMEGLAKEGRTMVMVTHEMAFARKVSSQIVFLHEGKIEEQGPPEDVFTNPSSERCREFVTRTH